MYCDDMVAMALRLFEGLNQIILVQFIGGYPRRQSLVIGVMRLLYSSIATREQGRYSDVFGYDYMK